VQLRLHNTLTRTKEVFEPIDPSRVRLYDCGPTVYQRIHVGNARSFVVFDVLYRLLRHLYGEQNVVYVRNITDIDDKIIDQARANGESIRELTERTTAQFHEDLDVLGCLKPDEEPRATEHVPEMVALIERLIERGHAYAADGHVLFSVPSMPAYGRLSGRNREEQIAGARVDVAPYKRDSADFVLWKPSTDDQPGWDSPWGHGRPGWHIECSAMSERYLGPLPFDIHAGGLDLIFPHHENEIAQSCCAHGIEQMARFWLHNGFLDMRGEKMSKSLGNVARLEDVRQVIEPPEEGDEIGAPAWGEVLRWSMLGAQYRQPLDFSYDVIFEAKRERQRFYSALSRAGIDTSYTGDKEPDAEFLRILADDLNTPEAMAHLRKLLGELNVTLASSELMERGVREAKLYQICSRIRANGSMLGLLEHDPDFILRNIVKLDTGVVNVGRNTRMGRIISLVEERTRARVARNFAEADRIRAVLAQEGIILEDRPDGTTDWRRA
jgi:cysteinyl-tRNA synthetase